MTITGVHLLSIPVTDQDRARDFYVNTLGLDLVSEEPMGPDQRWIRVAPKGSATSMTLVTWFPNMPAGSLNGLVLATSDVDGEAARLRAAGIEVTEPEDAPWGRYVRLRDPDGNGLIVAGAPAS